MMRFASKLSMASAALVISAGLAFAQTPQAPAAAPPKAPPAAAPKTSKSAPKKPRTAESIECSKQADTKKLHGKERKSFRAKCMRDLKKKAAPAPAKKN